MADDFLTQLEAERDRLRSEIRESSAGGDSAERLLLGELKARIREHSEMMRS